MIALGEPTVFIDKLVYFKCPACGKNHRAPFGRANYVVCPKQRKAWSVDKIKFYRKKHEGV